MAVHYKKATGFTIIELMITVAIVAIIAAIALPSYQNYIMKSRRTDGLTALADLRLAQEKFRSNCPHYAASVGASQVCAANSANSVLEGDTESTEAFYTISMSSPSNTEFIITATGQNGQENDTGCESISIDETGEISPADCDNK